MRIYRKKYLKNQYDMIFHFCFVLPLVFLVFIDFFGFNRGLLQYADECVCIFYILFIFYELILFSELNDYKILAFLVFFIFIGLIGNVLISDVDFNINIILLDTFMVVKPYIFLMASLLYYKHHFSYSHIAFFCNISKFMISFIFIGGIIFLAKNNFDFLYVRNVKGYYLFSGFTGTLASYILIFEFLILLSNSHYKLFWTMISFISILLTTSGVGLLAIFIIFVFCFLYSKFNLNWYCLFFFGMFACLIGWNEISSYLLDTTQARSLMYVNAFKCLVNYFPFGTGFGNYGSYGAAYSYSKLYFNFGYDNVWGLQPWEYGGPSFLLDTYYPMIIAQFGFFGFAIFLILVITTFFKLYRRRDFVTLTIFLSLIIAGLGFYLSSTDKFIQFYIFGFSYTKFIYSHSKKNRIIVKQYSSKEVTN